MDSFKMTGSEKFFRALSENALRCCENGALIERTAEMVNEAPFVYTMGVGKMGYIAGKFAASLKSVGRASCFLDATECAHGDLGGVIDRSLVVMFSKSGNSRELTFCIEHLLKKHVKIIVITNNLQSPLALAAEFVIPMHIEIEGDANNLLPLISTEIALAIADAIVVHVSELRSLSQAVFAANHPAGQIGMNLNRCIKDLAAWRKRKPFVHRDDKLLHAMATANRDLCGIACVINAQNSLIGIVSDGDVRRAMIAKKVDADTLVEDVMNRTPKYIEVNSLMIDAYKMFEDVGRKIIALPVVEQNQCVGVMTVHDLF